MGSFLILFSIGYSLGIKGLTISDRPEIIQKGKVRYLNIAILLKACIIIAILAVAVHFFAALFAGKITLSLTSIGQNYQDFYTERRSTGKTSFSEFINFFCGFPRLVVMVLGLYYFKELTKIYKFLVIAVLALWVITNTLSFGNQKTVGDIVIYIAVVSSIRMLDVSPMKRNIIYIQLIGLAVIFLVFFSVVQYQRLIAVGTTVANIDERMNLFTGFNWDHAFFRLLGPDAGFALAIFTTGYLSGGYYGLSLCMQLPFVWTFGVGNSYSLMAFLDRYLGIHSLLDKTYLLRMENEIGWNGLMAWNTIFPWLASDLTFVGALIIFIPIAYVYAVCWKEIVRYRNPISILMFSMLTMGLIFVPANNQLLHGYDGFITTIIMTILWLAMHKSYNLNVYHSDKSHKVR